MARSYRLAGQIQHAAVAKWRWTVALVVLIAAVVTFGYYANPSAGDSGPVVAGAPTSPVGAQHRPVDDWSRTSRAALPDTAKPGSPHPKKQPDVAPPRLIPGALIAYHLLRGSHPSATPAVKTNGASSATPGRVPSAATVGPPSTTETTLGPPTTTTTTTPPPDHYHHHTSAHDHHHTSDHHHNHHNHNHTTTTTTTTTIVPGL